MTKRLSQVANALGLILCEVPEVAIPPGDRIASSRRKTERFLGGEEVLGLFGQWEERGSVKNDAFFLDYLLKIRK